MSDILGLNQMLVDRFTMDLRNPVHILRPMLSRQTIDGQNTNPAERYRQRSHRTKTKHEYFCLDRPSHFFASLHSLFTKHLYDSFISSPYTEFPFRSVIKKPDGCSRMRAIRQRQYAALRFHGFREFNLPLRTRTGRYTADIVLKFCKRIRKGFIIKFDCAIHIFCEMLYKILPALQKPLGMI